MIPKVDQPENPLFTNGENYQMNACVGDNGGPYELFHYGEGFFNGGHAIVSSAEKHEAPVDFLIYPAAFSYRHGIELFLKQMSVTLNRILETGKTFGKNHSLKQRWEDVLRMNGEVNADLMDPVSIARAGELIGYFDEFDPSGTVFRYPEDLKGNRHLTDHKLINVIVLREQMKEIQEILARWYYQASDILAWQLEQKHEYRTV